MLIKTIETVFKKIKKPFVVGLSGGPDSMALLNAMVELNLDPIAGYYNHNLREDSLQEAEFVQNYTESKNIRFMEGSGDVRHYAEMQNFSIEEAARNLRYDFLFQLASGMEAGAVVVAHHAGDQVETLLMNLLRGSGMKGLSGMKVVSKPNPWSGTIPLIRPLLDLSKEQILDYISKHEIPYWEDPSNLELIYHRNKIRQELLPQLEELVPGFRRRMLQTAKIFSEDNQTLDQFSEKAWELCVNTQGTSFIQLSRDKFLKNPPAIQRRMLMKAL
ncbi:MAG: tRNA lysidine(34) synthetase TilS, partial [Candidatus Heimdallarchaeota archaeon]|nr:tRNA lysidine(34) synthetase TilS [Candidatus Heimdallarchaeota archaeon]